MLDFKLSRESYHTLDRCFRGDNKFLKILHKNYIDGADLKDDLIESYLSVLTKSNIEIKSRSDAELSLAHALIKKPKISGFLEN